MDHKLLGERVLPTMRELPKRVPKLSAAVLCTPDGLNICSIGLDEAQVGKLSALSGSLLSMGNAAVRELRPGDEANVAADSLAIKVGNFQLLSIRVDKPNGHLVLTIAADDCALGLMIVSAEYVVRELIKVIGEA